MTQEQGIRLYVPLLRKPAAVQVQPTQVTPKSTPKVVTISLVNPPLTYRTHVKRTVTIHFC